MTATRVGAVLTWFLLVGVCGTILVKHPLVQSELSLLLPQGASLEQKLLLDQIRTGPTSRMLLIAIKNGRPDALADASKRLAAWMRKSGGFTFVGNGQGKWLQSDLEMLFRYRYLLSPNVDDQRFQPPQLRQALQGALRSVVSPLSSVLDTHIREDLTREFQAVLQMWLPDAKPNRHDGVWMSSDKKQAILLAESKAPGFDLDKQELLQEQLRTAFAEVVTSVQTPEAMTLELTGPSVFSVEARARIKQESWKLSAIAICLAISFLFAVYRSLTVIALCMVPFASAVICASAGVGLTFGFIHGVTLAFGITLIGVTIDYPLHFFTHMAQQSSPESTLKDIWPTIRLGMITTMIGFSAMMLTDFPGLSQIGLFAAIGLLVAGCVTRWVLPVFVPQGFQPVASLPNLSTIPRLSRKFRWLMPLVALIAMTTITVAEGSLWEQDIANLTPISVEKRQRDRELRKQLGAPDVRELIIIRGKTDEEVLKRSEDVAPILNRLVHDGLLAGYEMASQKLPSSAIQRMRQASLPRSPVLRRNLRRAMTDLPFSTEAFEPFVEAVDESRQLAPLTIDQLRDTDLGSRVSPLVIKNDNRWHALVLLSGINDGSAIAAALNKTEIPYVNYVDLKSESNALITSYRNKTSYFVGWGLLAIAVVLAMVLRSAKLVIRVLLPVSLSLLVVIAILRGVGQELSMFHLASFLLVVGLGLDYALFLNRKFKTDLDFDRTIAAVLVCAITTILVFGVLAFSTIPVLHAIGITAASGSFACLVFTILLSSDPAGVQRSEMAT